MSKTTRRIPQVGLFVLLALLCPRCRQESAGDAPMPGESTVPKPAASLVFPDELRVDDGSVNELVGRALSACGSEDYEAFRLLWSAKESPLPREEFEQGWHAVVSIRVRGLEKGFLDADPSAGRDERETVYALLAEVSLDPAQPAGQKQPQREVVLMLARERDEWRLAKAPKAMRDWIKQKQSSAPPIDSSAPAVAGGD